MIANLATIKRELNTQWNYYIIALKGKVKGESIERDYIFLYMKETSSGINIEV